MLIIADSSALVALAVCDGLPFTGSQGILLLAKHDGLIERVAPFTHRLRTSDSRTSESLIQRILQLAGEAVCQKREPFRFGR